MRCNLLQTLHVRVLSQISLWDKIIERPEDAVLKVPYARNKYRLIDQVLTKPEYLREVSTDLWTFFLFFCAGAEFAGDDAESHVVLEYHAHRWPHDSAQPHFCCRAAAPRPKFCPDACPVMSNCDAVYAPKGVSRAALPNPSTYTPERIVYYYYDRS